MKKVLSMALMLIMVLTLFAVPTMAVIVADEYISNGDLEDCAEDYKVVVGNSTENPHVANNTPAYTSNSHLTKVVVQNENKVVQVSSTSDLATVNGPRFTKMDAGVQYVASVDVCVTKKYTTIDGVDYGQFNLEIWNAATTRINWGEGKATSKDGQDTINGTEVTYKNIGGSTTTKALQFILPLNTWYTVSAPVTPTSAYGSGGSVAATIRVDSADPNEVYGYFDNYSLAYQEEKAEITTTVTGNGTLTGLTNGALVDLNSSNVITLTPADGSYLKSLTVGGTDVTDAVTTAWNRDAYYFVSTYTVVPTGDTAIVAEFADYTKVTKVNENMDDSAVNWTKSSTGAFEVATDAKYGNVLKLTAGQARSPQHVIESGLYKVSFDAKADTTGGIKVLTYATQSAATCKWNGTAVGYYTKNITTDWAHYEAYFDPFSLTEETNTYLAFELNGAAGLYLDNVKVEYYSTAAVEPPVVEPEEYNVTINTDPNANITLADEVVEAGGDTTFTVAPKFGYYIQSITVGGTAIDVIDAYKGATYTIREINANTEIVVTIEALADSNISGVSSAVATLPAVFAEAGEHVTFGKVLDDNATEYGIELRYENGDPVKTAKTQTGPEFKANSKNENGQYAVEIEGLTAGTYRVRTYVKVAGTTTYGIATTFTVVE